MSDAPGAPAVLPPLVARVVDPVLRGPRVLADAVLALGTLLVGAALRFTQDDAYITLRYARNLADGQGLVFNAGERVEGYTNFLWTAWLAIPHRLDVDPVLWSDASSLTAGVVTVLVARRIAQRVIGDAGWAVVACGLLVAFHSFAIYLTGGLETQWQTCFVTVCVALVLRAVGEPSDLPALAAASFVGGLALLTRLDSVVLLGALVVPALWRLRGRGELSARVIAAAALPATLVVAPWLVWKWRYYDALLPNTFTAKQTPILWAVGRGLLFLLLFAVLSFGFVLWPMVRSGRTATRATAEGRALRVLVAAWLVYLLWVGADFMEFRFLVPVMPLGMVLVVAAMSRVPHRRAMAAIAVLVVGSLAKWYLFYPALVGIESARALEEHVEQPAGWLEAGRVLRRDFPRGESGGPTIAITAAGALPYEARLRTVDMLGLADVGANEAANRWELTKLKAGHEHIATVDYLVRSGVDLILGGLITEDCDDLERRTPLAVVRQMFLTYDVEPADIPAEATLRAIPLDQRGQCLYALDVSAGSARSMIQGAGYAEVGRPGRG